MSEDFLSNYAEYLEPSRWSSRNGVLAYSILPVWGVNFTPDDIFAELKTLVQIYHPFRLQVQCGFLIFNTETSEFKFFYSSANTRIHEQPFLYIYRQRASACLRNIKSVIDKAEKHQYLNSILQSYGENSSDTNISPVYLKFVLVCPQQHGQGTGDIQDRA
jgi:hypothetical protein